jgi:DNA-directed RNA polymerase subunit omega
LYDESKESEYMIYPSIDLLLNQVGSKYLLVNIVARRAKEMAEKQNYQKKDYVSKKEIGKALEEVLDNLVKVSQ